MIKLLHVDDDPDILEIAKIALEYLGDFEVVQCASGEDALRKVENFIPDVFLLDVMMPNMTGPETLKKLQEIPGLQNVPAIFMTASASSADQRELLDLGAKKVISKPFDPMGLSQLIKSALGKST